MIRRLFLSIIATIFLFGNTIVAQTYCTTGLYSSGTSFGDQIDVFTVGSFTKNSSASPGGSAGFADFTGDTIYLNQASVYSLSVTYGPLYQQGSAVWIDFNDDGDWADAGEHLWSAPNSASSHSGNLIISGTADTGFHRLRVRCNFASTVAANGSCSSFTYGEAEDYTVYIGHPPPCPAPIFLTASSVTSTTATIGWQSNGTDFELEYGPVGFTQGTGDTASSTTSSKALTGLTQNTTYDVYVRSDCSSSGNGISTWGGPLTFTTLCTSISSFPSTENFDNTTAWQPSVTFNPYPDVIDNCWDRSPVQSSYGQYGWTVASGTTYGWQTGPNNDKSGSGQYVYVNSSGSSAGDSSFLNLPLFDLSTLTNPLFTYYTHMYGSGMGSLVLQVSSNGTAWTSVYTLSGQRQDSAGANWEEQQVDLTNYKSSTTYIRFAAVSAGSSGGDISIDEVSMAEAPPCPKPTATSISNVTSSSAVINFLSQGTAFPIEYGPAGFTQGTGMVDTATATGYSLTGLFSNTVYDVYVRNNCISAGNGISAWAGPYTFRTLCNSMAEGYTQNFDGLASNQKEPCWYDLSYGDAHNVYAYLPPTWSNITPASSPNVLYWYNNNASMSYVITPQLDGLDGDTTQVKFKITHNYWNSSASINVYVGTMSDRSDTSTISWVDTINPSQYIWSDHTLLLDNVPTGHGFVVFARDNSQTFTEVDIDDFAFEGIPQCLPPTAGNAQALSSSSLIVNWTGPGTTYDIEYGVAGFTQGTGSITTGVTSPDTISNLVANTCYDVYVRTDCGAGSVSPWYGPIQVCTPCSAVNMPYTEDFTTWPPNCFIFTKTGTWDWAADNSGAGHAYANFWGNSSGTAMMTSGPINLNAKARVKFKWAHQYNTFYPDDQVLLLSRVLGSPTWDTLIDLKGPSFDSPNSGTTSPPPLADFVEEKINLDSASYYGQIAEFQFVAVTDFGPGAFIDDFVVEAQPICTEPDQVAISMLTGYTADVTWNTSVGSQFEIEYGPQGFVQGSGVFDTVTTAPHTIAGLTPVTCYDLYIRTLCGTNGNSIWTGPVPFCTLVSCPPPTNVALQSAGQNTASFSWTTGSASSWNYVNVAQGFGPGTGTVMTSAAASVSVTNLVPGTAYSFFVRDSCGPGDVSTWAGPINYTTPLCDTSQQCDYTIYMHDSYGDGWNGFEVGIAVGSVTFNTFGSTFTSGYEDTAQFSACNAYPTAANIINGGSYPTEVSFEIVSAQGDTVLIGNSFNSSSTGTTAGNFTPNCIPISCPAPDSLSASSITATTATLNWTATGNSFQVSYGMPPFAPASGTIANTTTTSHPITGLSGNTQYGFYVREICSVGDTSLWNGPYTFYTLCTTVSLPFYDNLDGPTWTPDDISFSPVNDEIDQCWTRTPASSSSYSWRVRSIATGSSSTGPNADYSGTGSYIYTEASSGSSGSQAEILSPAIDLSTAVDPYLRFAYLFYGTQIDVMYVEGYDGTTWTTLDSIVGQQQTSGTTWADTLVSLSSYTGTASFQFRMRAISMGCCAGDMALDEFAVFDSASVACPGPANVAVTGLGCDTLTLSWNSDPGTIVTAIRWDTLGFNPLIGGATVFGATSPYTFTGLNPSTAYQFYIVDSCSLGISAPAMVIDTTANGPLPTISFVATQTSVTATDAIVNFDASASMNYSSVSWNFGDGSANGTNAVENHSYTMNQTYNVTLTLTNGCGSVDTTFAFEVNGISIDESELSRTLNIFPNPTDGKFNVDFSVEGKQKIKLRVMDALGRIVMVEDLGMVDGTQHLELDLSGNASGIYMIQIDSSEGSITERLTLRGK